MGIVMYSSGFRITLNGIEILLCSRKVKKGIGEEKGFI